MSLVVPFDTRDSEFVRGFEMGALWVRMHLDAFGAGRADGDVDDSRCPSVDFVVEFMQLVHVSNAEMVMRLCETSGRQFRAIEAGEDLLILYVGAAQ